MAGAGRLCHRQFVAKPVAVKPTGVGINMTAAIIRIIGSFAFSL